MKDFGAAGTAAKCAAEIRPEVVESSMYNNALGGAFYGQRKYAAALEAFTKVIELDSGKASGYGNRGDTLIYMGRYEEALADLTHVLELAPHDHYVNTSTAWLLVVGPTDLQNVPKAISILDSGIVKESDASLLLGAAHYRLGKYRQAAAGLLTRIGAKLVVPEDDGSFDLDPDSHQVLVTREPSELEMRVYSIKDIHPAPSQWYGVRITRDARPLQPGKDYTLRYDPERQTLAVYPAAGVFGDGVYRLSIPRTLSAIHETSTNLVVSVRSTLPAPRQLTFENDRDGYASAKFQSSELIVLVPPKAKWRYLDDGSDQGVAWRDFDFDDSKWQSGDAVFGYGDDQKAVVQFGDDGQNKFPTTYFRHAFHVAGPNEIPLLHLGLRRDDGAAVYLNGQQILQVNLPDDATYSTYAWATVSGESESTYHSHIIDCSALLKGENRIGVEVHQSTPTSSDLSFDLQLMSPTHAIIAFEDLFGESPRQIPSGATIVSAMLRVSAREHTPVNIRPSICV